MSGNDIAVIAMTGRFPNAASVAELWQALCAGRELLHRFTREELVAAGVAEADLDHRDYVPARGILPQADMFDAEFFGYSPREAELIDPQQRLFLECAWEAAEEAGYVLTEHTGRVGVFAAAPASTYPALTSVENPLLVQVGNDVDFTASRVSYKLNLRGPSVAVSSACSSSLVAVHLAAQSLLTGEVDLALAGGVSVRFPQARGYRWTPGSILSPDGHCRTFGAGAEGTVEANGVAVVLLKLLDQAVADGDPIHAVLKGSAVNNDGADRVGFTAPGVRGQTAVIRDALAFADVDPGSVGYVEAHGTATTLGDPIEVRALAAVYGQPDRLAPCAIGSLKSNLGHLNHVAGVAGLIKAALCLSHRRLVASLHATALHPDLDLAGGALRVQTELADWAATGPRRAAVSSFGMGGTNAHIILEEPPARSDAGSPGHDAAVTGPHALLLSARTGPALAQARSRLGEWLRERPGMALDAVAYTLQCGRQQFRHRAVVIATDAGAAADSLLGTSAPVVRCAEPDGVDRPVAFLFPGQGAQYPAMGRQLYDDNRVFRHEFDECARRLRDHLDGLDLREVLFGASPSARDLDQTWLTQPALFSVEYALARFWLEQGVEPAAMLGHSVGGYVAACLAGVFSLPAALALVAHRGRLMQQTQVGAMLAIGAGESEVGRWLRERPSLGLSAVNAPEQCVVGGDVAGIEALRREVTAAGVPATRLRVTRAFHTAAVQPMMAEFAAVVAKVDLNPPTRPFISDLTGTWAAVADVTTPEYWLRHLRETVRFGEGIATLRRDLDPVFLEVGPGRVGISLAAAQGAQDTIAGVDPGTDSVESLAGLWLAGAGIDWARGWSDRRPGRVVLPTYPFQRRRHWWGGSQRPTGEAPGAAGTGVRAARQPVDRWFYQPIWRDEPRPPVDIVSALRATEPRWVLLGDRTDLARGLAQLLTAAGRDVLTVPADELGDADPVTCRRLTTDIAGSAGAVRVVHLIGVDADGGSGPEAGVVAENGVVTESGVVAEDGVVAAATAYWGLATLVRSLAETGALDRIRLSVVTGVVSCVLGAETPQPSAAAVAGVLTVVPQEYPGLTVDHIETDGRSVLALARELAGLAGRRVAVRGMRRFVPSAAGFDLTGLTLPPSRLRREGLYLVTGGLGRVGLLLADYLARRYAARLVLVSRRAVPDRSHWPAVAVDHTAPMAAVVAQLLRIEAAGGAVLPVRADVADLGQLRAAIAAGQAAFGRRVDGVVHAAGLTETTAFGLLAETTRPSAEAQLRTKAGGLWSLASAFAGPAPDFVLSFSSLAVQLGGLGFSAYAAANSALDAAVRLANRRQPGVWSVVNLDGWAGPHEGHGSAFRAGGGDLPLIRPEDADELFDVLFRLLDVEQIHVSVTDLGDRLDHPPHPTMATDGPLLRDDPVVVTATRHPRPELRTPYRPPADDLEQAVADIWQDLLGVEPIGADDNFFELGGHSLLAMQLVTRLRGGFDLEVPLRTIFQASTIAALSAQMTMLFQSEGAPR